MAEAVFGLSTAHIDKATIPLAFERCGKLGLEAVEFFTEEYGVAACREIAARAKDAGLRVDYHAPWDGPYDFGLSDPDIGFAHLEATLARAHAMGAGHVVAHLGRYDLDDPDGREKALDRLIGITRRLLESLSDARVLLCYEDNTLCHDSNPLGDQPRDFSRLFEAIDSPWVGMTIDTGHAHVSGNTRAYLESFGRRIRYVHLNDNDGIGDLHEPPSAGTIDWPELIGQLAFYGVEPSFGIEFNERYVEAELPPLRDLVAAHAWGPR